MIDYYRKNKDKINKMLYIFIIIIFIYVFFKFIFHYIAPFIFAYILSLILYPFALLLNKKLKLNKSLSSFICCAIFIVFIIFFSKTILSRILLEGKYFFVNIPFYTKEFIIKIERLKIKYNHVLDIIPQSIKENLFVSIYNNLSDFINKLLKSSSTSIVKFVPHMFFNIIITILATFFFIKDKSIVEKFFYNTISKRLMTTLSQLKKGCLCGISAYIKAELIMMSTTGIICTIGFCIIRYPYALFLGLMTALIDALPILGTGFIIWPWAIYCFLNDNYNRAIILLVTYLVVTTTRHILSPKLISNQIGVHPLIMLIAIYIGLEIFGVFGMIIGPIIVITGKLIIEETKN